MNIPSETRRRVKTMIMVSNRRFMNKRNPLQESIYQYQTFWMRDIFYWVHYSLRDGLKYIDYPMKHVIKDNRKLHIFSQLDSCLWRNEFYSSGEYDLRYAFMKVSKFKLLKCLQVCKTIYNFCEVKYKYKYKYRLLCRALLGNTFKFILDNPKDHETMIKLILVMITHFYEQYTPNPILNSFFKEKIYTSSHILVLCDEIKKYHSHLITKLS